MVAFRATFGPVVAERYDLVLLLDWSARSDAKLFSQLIVCSYSPLYESLGAERMRGWREAIEQAAATGPVTGRVRASLRTAAAVASGAYGTILDTALASDTEGDPIFTGWLYGSCVVLDALHRPGPAWQARAQAVTADLCSSPHAAVRDLGAVVDAHLLLLEDRFDEAAELFEAAIRRGGGTWADQTAVYMVGDCHLLAGRPQAALQAYARGVAHARDMGARDDIGFQAEGIVAALTDLGRDEEALETLGASDSLTGEGVLPREHNAYWGGVMAGRISSARVALGEHAADAAYARGRTLAVEEVVERLLSYGAPVGAAS